MLAGKLGAPGPDEGRMGIIFCAVGREIGLLDNGDYFLPVGKKTKASKLGEGHKLAEGLCEWIEARPSELEY
jgi:hypothetical protein